MVDVPFVMDINHRSMVWEVATSPGQRIRISWTGVVKDRACGTYGYAVQAGVPNAPSNSGEVRFNYPGQGGAIGWVTTVFGPRINFDAFTDGYCSTGQLLGVTLDVSAPVAGYCQYGTQSKSGVQLAIYVTPELMAGIAVTLGLEFLLPFLAVFYFTTVAIDTLCKVGPPPMPTLTADDVQGSIDFWRQILQAVLWTQYCECSPGTPAPSPYPLPGGPAPVGWPAAPVFDCSNVDPCAALVEIQRSLAALNKAIAANLELTTVMQRFRVPFGTIDGLSTTVLSGAGAVTIDRTVGVRVELAQVAELRELEGNPPYVWDAGWMSVSDGGAMLQERRITRSLQTWHPEQMQLATQFGFFLKAGVSATFTFLLPEP